MALRSEDAVAIASTAQRLGVDPKTLGALFELESGTDPNIWGGAGGQYRGLIQFGPGARKEVGLPSGPMTISEQLPYVEKYFQQRGFQPGKHGPTELYRTVLVGNPGQSGTDSFGTNSDSAAQRMLPGGDLYKRFSGKFDSALGGSDLSALMSATDPTAARGVDPLSAALSSVFGAGMKGTQVSTRPTNKAMGLDFIQQLSEVDPGAAAQVAAVTALLPQRSRAAAEIGTAVPATAAVGASPASGLKVIEYLTGDPGHSGYRDDHGGNNYHEHLAFETRAQRDAAMQKLKAAGIQIGSVNDGKHSPNSYHYQDLAFDVPAAQVPVGKEQELSRRVRSILGIG